MEGILHRDDQSNVFYHVHKYFIHKTLWKIFLSLDSGTGGIGIIKALPVLVYLSNDWELSHFNTLMFVAISVSAASVHCSPLVTMIHRLAVNLLSCLCRRILFKSFSHESHFSVFWQIGLIPNGQSFIIKIAFLLPQFSYSFPADSRFPRVHSRLSSPRLYIAVTTHSAACSMGSCEGCRPYCRLLQSPGLCSARARCVSRLWPRAECCPGPRRTAGCSHREPGLQ